MKTDVTQKQRAIWMGPMPKRSSQKTDFQAKIRPRISSRKPTEADDNPALPDVYNDDNDFAYIQSLSNML